MSLLFLFKTAAGGAKSLTADPGSYAVTGTNATLRHGWVVSIGSGSYAVTGTDATLTKTTNKSLSVDPGSYAVSGTAATFRMGENLRPDGDVSDGGWTTGTGGSDLWTAIDEVAFDDSDYIRSGDNPSNDACEVTISNPSGAVGEHVTVEYRYCKYGSGRIDLTVSLKEGSTVIASWTHTDIGTSETTASQSLSAGEVSSITDYSALSLMFEANEV